MITNICTWIRYIHAAKCTVSTKWIHYKVIHDKHVMYVLWHYWTYLDTWIKRLIIERYVRVEVILLWHKNFICQ